MTDTPSRDDLAALRKAADEPIGDPARYPRRGIIDRYHSAVVSAYEAGELVSRAPSAPVEDDRPDVRCNSCGWLGYNDDLVASIDSEDGEPSNPCPNCGTDAYLMDIETPVEVAGLVERLRGVALCKLEAAIGPLALDCNRVWEAWSVGTMGPDDFEPVNERIDELVDEAISPFVSALEASHAASAAKDAEIARLTAERDRWREDYHDTSKSELKFRTRALQAEAALAESEAKLAVAYETAADEMIVQALMVEGPADIETVQSAIRALATEDQAAALAAYVRQHVEAETRACAEAYPQGIGAILSRLVQPAGEA